MATDSIEIQEAKASRLAEDDGRVIADEQWQRFRAALDAGHREYCTEAKKFDDFYIGKQWDEGDKQRLETEGRPAKTVNVILSTVNTMIGEQLANKVEARFRPRRGGAEDVASELNYLTKFILQQTRFNDLEEEVYADGLIQDRGYYDIRLDFSSNIQGDVSISSEDPLDVIPDPNARSYDPKDWSEVFLSRWMTLDDLEAEYGREKRELVELYAEMDSTNGPESIELAPRTFGTNSELPEADFAIRRVRVVERQHKKLTCVRFWVDNQTGDQRAIPEHISEEDAQAIALNHNYSIWKRRSNKVRWTVTADRVLLHDDWSPYRTFTIIPFFPYYRRGRPFGVVRNLVDPQELLNKTTSQELHIVNTTANSGWVIEENSLVDMDAHDLAERGAETGLVLEYRRNHTPPQKIQPNQIPTGIDRISVKAASSIREISAVNAAMSGMARADQSGTALQEQTSRGKVQVSVVLKNLERSRRLVVQKVLELVQDFYSETRFYSIVSDEEDPIIGGGMESERFINGVDPQGNIINDVTKGEYEVIIGTAPASESGDDEQFTMATQLRQIGVAIPDHVLVRYSGLHRRFELAQALKEMQGFGEPTPEQEQMMQFQMETDIKRAQLELAELQSKIDTANAKAMLDTAKAASLDGHNEAALELRRLQQERELKERELALRIALSAKGHQAAGINAERSNATKMAIAALNTIGQAKKAG